MKIKIYQIDKELDTRHLLFRSLAHIKQTSGGIIPAEIYECIYSGEVETDSLADLYVMFNINHPHDYRGHSLSVSDVVEIIHDEGKSTFHMCDSFGFAEIEFKSDEAGRRPERE